MEFVKPQPRYRSAKAGRNGEDRCGDKSIEYCKFKSKIELVNCQLRVSPPSGAARLDDRQDVGWSEA